MSDTSTVADAGQGAAAPEAPAPAAPEPSVQSAEGTTEPQSGGGQGFIEPYLEGVPQEARDIVAERLERYRQESDASFNKRFEDTSTRLKAYQALAEDPAHLETPMALYDNLMQDPVGTLEWVAERFQEEMGRDIKADLLAKWQQATGQPAADPSADPDNQPLTRKEFEALQQEQAQKSQQEQQAAQARKTTEGWLTEATTKHGLELGEGDVVLKEAILRQAATLMPKVRNGQQAVEMAVEAIATRFAPKQKAAPTTSPKVATGGTGVAPASIDYSDARQRQAAMLSILEAQRNPNE